MLDEGFAQPLPLPLPVIPDLIRDPEKCQSLIEAIPLQSPSSFICHIFALT